VLAGDFVEAEDEDLGQLSWRDGYLSDWIIVVGDKTYPVHRANLAVGPRASSLFRKIFACHQKKDGDDDDDSSGSGTDCTVKSTDLSSRLPKPCWGVMDQVRQDQESTWLCFHLSNHHRDGGGGCG